VVESNLSLIAWDFPGSSAESPVTLESLDSGEIEMIFTFTSGLRVEGFC
jgi:hypothetical protein